jgi:ABC-type amino acid transport substrate-binding protein/nucleoid-associated protein YgaU
MKRIIASLLIIFCSSYIVLAANDPVADDVSYKALFIGIDDYNINELPDLSASVADSKSLKDLLESKYRFSDSKSLTNQTATKQNILKSIKDLVMNIGEDDFALIFFAGHGAEIGKEGYWVPSDASSLFNVKELISNIEVQEAIKESKCKHILILSDGFFAGTAFKSPSFFVNNDGTDSYYKKIKMLISRQAITSGGISPVIDAEAQRSVFTKYLIKFLEVNSAEFLDAGELYELIKYPIFSNSPNMPRFGHLQYTGHEGGQFVFRIGNKQEVVSNPNNSDKSLTEPVPNATDKGVVEKEKEPTKPDKSVADKEPIPNASDKGVVEKEPVKPEEKIVEEEEKKPVEKACDLAVSISQGEKLIVENWNNIKIDVKTNSSDAAIKWFYNGNEIASTKEIDVRKSGEYRVVVSESATCQRNASISIAQKEVDLSKVEVFIEEGNAVEYTLKGALTAKTFTKEAVQYEWRTGGLVISTEPVLTVFRSGEYEVILTYNGKEIAKDYSMVIVHPRIYTSVQGDTPKKIAEMFYKDENLESLIFKANLGKIKVGELIPTNTTLVIPAKEEAKQNFSIKTLTVGGVSDFAPFSSATSYKNGITTDIVKAVLDKMGQKNEITFSPLAKQTKDNSVVASYPIQKTIANSNDYIFSNELFKVDNVLFSKATEPFDFSDEKNIRKKTIACVLGNNIPEIDNYVAKGYVKVQACKTFEEAFRMLQRGQVDLVACPSLSAYNVFLTDNQIKQESFFLVNKPISSTSLYLGVSSKNPLAFDIIANFNIALDVLINQGLINKIIDEHLDEFQKKP